MQKRVTLLFLFSLLLFVPPTTQADDQLQMLVDSTSLIEAGAFVPYICGCPHSSILEQAPELGAGVSFTGSDCRSGKNGTCTGTCKYFFDADGDGKGRGIIYPCSWIHYLDAEGPQ